MGFTATRQDQIRYLIRYLIRLPYSISFFAPFKVIQEVNKDRHNKVLNKGRSKNSVNKGALNKVLDKSRSMHSVNKGALNKVLNKGRSMN